MGVWVTVSSTGIWGVRVGARSTGSGGLGRCEVLVTVNKYCREMGLDITVMTLLVGLTCKRPVRSFAPVLLNWLIFCSRDTMISVDALRRSSRSRIL